MAVTNTQSAELALTRKDFRGDGGKTRYLYFKATQGAAAGDAGSTFDLGRLPFGSVRILPGASLITCSALGASRTLDIGHRAYETRGGVDSTVEAEDLDALVANVDVSSAIASVKLSSVIKFDLHSRSGVLLVAQVNDGTIPIAAVLEGYIAYVTYS